MLAPVFWSDGLVMHIQEDGLGLQCPTIVLSQQRAPHCGGSVNKRTICVFQWRELVFPQNLKGNKFPANRKALLYHSTRWTFFFSHNMDNEDSLWKLEDVKDKLLHFYSIWFCRFHRVTPLIHKWHFLDGYMLLQLLVEIPEETKTLTLSITAVFGKTNKITNNYAKVLNIT